LVTTKEEILSLNNVTLVGRVGGEPNVRYFESGSVVCNLTLAVNRSSKKEEDPDWFNLEIWGRTAQVAADYVKKGSLIGISGNLKMEYWNDKSTGAQRSKPVVRVNRLDLLGSRKENEAAAGEGGDFDEF
jgi:single-strand DNA-binding protein